MARNKVQFQRGLSDMEFDRLYGTEEKCRKALFSWRWPEGFECPACGGFAHCELGERALWQCKACRTQTSLTAGILSRTRSLTSWAISCDRNTVICGSTSMCMSTYN